MNIVSLATSLLFVCILQVTALDLSESSWIWTPNELSGGTSGNAPPGTRAFRRDVDPPQGKVPILANVILTVDNTFTLWVNGAQIGQGTNFKQAGGFCVPLEPFYGNVFAIAGTNEDIGPNPAGVLAAIEIKYSDGTSDIIVSDSSWKTLQGQAPASFEQPGFDVSAWPSAIVEGPSGSAPWGAITIPASPQPSTNFNLTASQWIWTNEVQSAGSFPTGLRAFRKTINLPDGMMATSVKAIIATDNDFTLFIQGKVVATGTDAYSQAVQLTHPVGPTSQVTIAAAVNNTGGPAGLIMAIEVDSGECLCEGSCPTQITDYSWKYTLQANPSNDADMYKPGFDDSAWPAAMEEGPYGMPPWGAIPTVPFGGQ